LRNVRLVIEYDGTAFGGWQRQSNARTVQAVLEEALAGMTGGPVTLRGAGRTDAGVHARAQVACFETEVTIPLEGFRKGLNAALPGDVAVVTADEVAPDFDARRSARGKHYCYRLWTRPSRSPIACRWAWHVWQPLDLDAMQRAATALLGEHDFSAFRASDCERKNPVRVLRRADVTREGEVVRLDFEATAFLKNMVRILAGTLVEVGQGRRDAGSMATLLEGRDRTQTGRTAPPHGLTLERVWYEDPPGRIPQGV
jgi:tRNA pseudouridine38-40 synthase